MGSIGSAMGGGAGGGMAPQIQIGGSSNVFAPTPPQFLGKILLCIVVYN